MQSIFFMAWKMFRLNILMCSFVLDFVFTSGSSEFLCSMTSENAWKEKLTGKLPPLGGAGRGEKKVFVTFQNQS